MVPYVPDHAVLAGQWYLHLDPRGAPLEVCREPDISRRVPMAADPRPLLALSARTD